MDDLFRVCCLPGALIEISKNLTDLHLTIDRKGGEEMIRLQLLQVIDMLQSR